VRAVCKFFCFVKTFSCFLETQGLIESYLFTIQVRKDWYVFAVLSTLPWVGRELYEKKEQALEHLLVSIEVYLGKRSKKHHAALRVWALDTPHPQEEVCFIVLLKNYHSALFNFVKIYYCRVSFSSLFKPSAPNRTLSEGSTVFSFVHVSIWTSFFDNL